MLKQYWRGRVLMHGIALLTLFSVAAPTLMAHHGWGGYRDEEFEISGVVETPVSAAGPHASLTIKVEGKIWGPSGISGGSGVGIGHDRDPASRATRAARGAGGAPGPRVALVA